MLKAPITVKKETKKTFCKICGLRRKEKNKRKNKNKSKNKNKNQTKF